MELNLTHDLAALRRLTPRELCARYAEAFGEQPSTKNRGWLLKRLAQRLQSLAQGDLLSQRPPTRRRTGQRRRPGATTCPDPRADLLPARAATTAPPPRPPADSRRPAPGTVLTRKQGAPCCRCACSRTASSTTASPTARLAVARAITCCTATAFSTSKTPSPTKETPDQPQRPSRAARHAAPGALRRLHPQKHRRRSRTGIQQPRRPTRSRRSLRPQPGRRIQAKRCCPTATTMAASLGGNMGPARPATLSKADIQAGINRLRGSSTRSIASAAPCLTSHGLMETFEQHTWSPSYP